MKAWQRFARTVSSVTAIFFVGATGMLGAQQQAPLQRGQTPGPRFLVPILRSAEAGLGKEAGEMVRERMGDQFMLRTLWIIPKSDIENTLVASGYSQTEALNANDLKALAQLLRAEEYMDATVTKVASGYQADAYHLLVRGDGMVQPLPRLTGEKLNDIAKAAASEIEKSRKQLAGSASCMLNWRQNKFDEAAKDIERSLKDYPNSVFARVCALEIANTKKASPDSIIKLSEDILKIHPQNRRALTLVADAYNAAKMEDKYITTLTTLLAADPTNTRLQETVVNALGAAGKPEIAKPIIDEAVKQNPGDPSLIRLQWTVYRAMKDWRGAAQIGEELVKTDTAFADTTFWQRQIAAYVADSNTAKAFESASRAVAKFPQNTELLMTQGQLARQAGQGPVALEAFNKVIAIDPKHPGVNLQIAQIYSEQDKTEEMLSALRAAVAAGDDAKIAGGMALTKGNALFKAFSQGSKSQADGDAALRVLAAADSISPSETAKFLMGATEVTISQTILTQDAAPNKNCDALKKAQVYLGNAQIHVPAGGRAFPDQAKQLMDGLGQLNAYAEQLGKAICK
ncbi:MAG: Beta-barrel assembly-enhancing protease [Gemmatimonadaceae bacterium]|nr:Beta-barrel assembly-enhancing protease [Gemmatimonadaceae bacterium]